LRRYLKRLTRTPPFGAAIVLGLMLSVLAFGDPSPRRIGLTLIATAIAAEEAAGMAAPIYGIKIPQGYRDWRMISTGTVGTPVNDVRVKLGNDIAIEALIPCVLAVGAHRLIRHGDLVLDLRDARTSC
jgi:hypothetical protein